MRSLNTRYLVGIDHLRALASLVIVFYHGLHLLSLGPRAPNGDLSKVWWVSLNPIWALVEEGHTSVGLFMVLSGFVFSVGALGREIGYGAYLKNRLLRIYPLFLFMLLTAVVAFPRHYLFLSVVQTLLIQADFQGRVDLLPFTGMFWAVAVECQFYLLFPFLHRFIEREGVRWVFGVIALCTVMRLAAAVGGDSNARDVAYWHLLGRLDQFLIGMLGARLFKRLEGRALPYGLWTLAATATALGTIVAFNQLGGWPSVAQWKVLWPTIEGCVWGNVLVSYTCFAERVPRLLSRALVFVGTISYSIYMLHFMCITLLWKAWPIHLSSDPNLDSQLYVACIVLPVLLPLSWLSYYAIERPFLRMRVAYLR